MRLICTITDNEHENPYELSYYLTSQGIVNECEESSSSKGPIFNIWIYDEDQVEKALNIYQQFKENPKNPIYRSHYESAIKAEEEKLNQAEEGDESEEVSPKRRRVLSPAPYGPISILIILTAIFLFLSAQFQRQHLTPPQIPGVIQAPLLAPIERALIYDYPSYFEQRDYLLKVYTPEQIEQKKPPSADALQLLHKLKQTPVWMGIYDRYVAHHRNPEIPLSYHGPLFEKISSGELWRLFTPALLHFDLLHIFFNLLWFILLGNQIEFRLGWLRYLILVLMIGLISNAAQYLMSGPFFMGLSGIVVGMAAFIWARQQVAPWEGYLLNRFTLVFLTIFVIGMFALQIVFFFLQLTGKFQITIGIANTAHLVGGIVGYLLGRLRYFSIHSKSHK